MDFSKVNDRFQPALAWLRRAIPRWFDALFERDPTPGARWVPWAWIAALYLAGLFFWGAYLNWGKIDFDFHDWAEVSAPRIAFVGNAVRDGVLPLHMTDASALRGVTDRYMAIPDAILAPQMFLLLFLDTGPFVLANTWILYTLGALGLVWIARRYRLSPAAYAALFLLFNLNGHISAHLSVGHVNYASEFLFSWVIGLLLVMLEGSRNWRLVAAFAFLLFFILLQGGFHQLIWCLFLLGLVGILNWKHFGTVLKIGVASGLLGMVRLLPPALLLGRFDDQFISGYPTVGTILQALVTIQPPTDALAVRELYNSLGWWELDLFVGVIGLGFLAYFGAWRWLRPLAAPGSRRELLAPLAVLSLLSIGPLWGWMVKVLPIPLLTGERVSSRILILPFMVVLVLAAIHFQEQLDGWKGKTGVRIALLAGLGALVSDLIQHFRAWRVSAAIHGFPETPVDLSIKVVGNHPDPAYTALLILGFLVSLASAALLIYLVWRERPAVPRSDDLA